MTTTQIIERIKAGTELILPVGELEKKLESKRPLIIKLGMDPTAPDLHLGHAVVLSKMKLFQELGHQIVFIIGDFTTRIGDPTGRSKTRPALSEETINQNAQTYLRQVGQILDISKTKVVYNSTWLDTLTSRDWIKLCAQVTLARITERDDFAKRITANLPISFHELLYPLLQGYDSVILKADIEVGGSDQTFNLLMGRHLQEQYGIEPQVIVTMPLLEGLDGSAKMSKSLGNTIGLTESPDQAFGKIMSISDNLMLRYFKVLLNTTETELKAYQEEISKGTLHPMELKKELAFKIVQRFWGEKQADEGKKAFEALFQKKDLSQAKEISLPAQTPASLTLVELLNLLNAVASNTEARRLINEGAVTINGKKITDIKAVVQLEKGMHIKVGKHRFYKIG